MHDTGSADLRAEVASTTWYHTIDLGHGVVTPGLFDHRRCLPKLPIPASLAGKRCLDVASANGLFAFEMARRGAAEVVSIDLDDHDQRDYQGPPTQHHGVVSGQVREGFEIARRALGLDVERIDANVYDITPERYGRFDFVFIGNILLHLRDPARALAAVRTVVAGELLSFEPILLGASLVRPRTPVGHLATKDEPRWWTVNAAGHRRLVEAAGFAVERAGWPLFQDYGAWRPRFGVTRAAVRASPLQTLHLWLWTRQVGIASGWVLARPRHAPTVD